MIDRREEQIRLTGESAISFTLPSVNTILIVGALSLGLVLFLLYQAGKGTVKYVGEHPELIKLAMM
jgi:hypothetical protein